MNIFEYIQESILNKYDELEFDVLDEQSASEMLSLHNIFSLCAEHSNYLSHVYEVFLLQGGTTAREFLSLLGAMCKSELDMRERVLEDIESASPLPGYSKAEVAASHISAISSLSEIQAILQSKQNRDLFVEQFTLFSGREIGRAG